MWKEVRKIILNRKMLKSKIYPLSFTKLSHRFYTKKNSIYLKRIDEDRFIGLLNVKDLKKIEKNKAVPFCFLAVAVIMIGVGVVRGEHLVVLQKAVNICLECIGIG